MYTGSFTEIETPVGTLRVADVALHNANGDIIDLSNLSVTANVVFPATQNVSVVNFPATQNVAGTVNVGNFPSSFNVGNFPATQNVAIVSGELSTINIGNFPVTTSNTANLTALGANTANAIALLAANPARKGYVIFNDSSKSLRIAYGPTITANSYSVTIGAGNEWSPEDGWTGALSGLMSAADANGKVIRVTELT